MFPLNQEIRFFPSTYFMDDAIPTLVFVFLKYPKANQYVGQIDLPNDVMAELYTQHDKCDGVGDIGQIEVVNPEGFMNSDKTNDIIVNGYNVKELIRDAMNYISKHPDLFD